MFLEKRKLLFLLYNVYSSQMENPSHSSFHSLCFSRYNFNKLLLNQRPAWILGTSYHFWIGDHRSLLHSFMLLHAFKRSSYLRPWTAFTHDTGPLPPLPHKEEDNDEEILKTTIITLSSVNSANNAKKIYSTSTPVPHNNKLRQQSRTAFINIS